MDLNHFLDECGEAVSKNLLDEKEPRLQELHFELEQCSGFLVKADQINALN